MSPLPERKVPKRAAEVHLPDRPLSQHPNFVTPSGLKALKTAMAEARSSYEAAQQIEDVTERRRASASAFRDMKYHSGLSDLFGGRQTLQVNAAPPCIARDDARAVSGEMGTASYLSHGRAKLRSTSIGNGEEHRARTNAQEARCSPVAGDSKT